MFFERASLSCKEKLFKVCLIIIGGVGEGGRISLLREDEGEALYFQRDSVCATIFHSRTIEGQCVFRGEL